MPTRCLSNQLSGRAKKPPTDDDQSDQSDQSNLIVILFTFAAFAFYSLLGKSTKAERAKNIEKITDPTDPTDSRLVMVASPPQSLRVVPCRLRKTVSGAALTIFVNLNARARDFS
jgi:hypothetical protein